MGDWKQRAKKVDKRTREKHLARAFIQDLQHDKDRLKRKKRQNIQAKMKEQEFSVGDVDLEE